MRIAIVESTHCPSQSDHQTPITRPATIKSRPVEAADGHIETRRIPARPVHHAKAGKRVEARFEGFAPVAMFALAVQHVI